MNGKGGGRLSASWYLGTVMLMMTSVWMLILGSEWSPITFTWEACHPGSWVTRSCHGIEGVFSMLQVNRCDGLGNQSFLHTSLEEQNWMERWSKQGLRRIRG